MKAITVDPSLNSKKKKNKKKKLLLKAVWDKSKCHRKHLVFGASQVLQHLQKDNLCALLVSRDSLPHTVTSPMIALCRTRNVPAGAIGSLQGTLVKATHFAHCSFMGFKRSVAADESNEFYDLYEMIQRKLPKLPDIGLEENVSPLLALQSETDDRTVAVPVVKPPTKDYSYLYIKKESDIQKTTMDADDFLSLNSLQPEHEETDNDGEEVKPEEIPKSKKDTRWGTYVEKQIRKFLVPRPDKIAKWKNRKEHGQPQKKRKKL